MKLPTHSACAGVASRGSLELASECCNRGQTIIKRYMLQHSAVPFCELVWPTTANVCLWKLHGSVLDSMHQSATGVAEIDKSTNLKKCPHTFVYMVCIYIQYLF